MRFIRLLCLSVATAGFLMLGACGFAPLYGTLGRPAADQSDFDSVSIAGIPDRSGQYLRNALMDRLYSQGRPDNARYTLTIEPIRENKTDLDLTKDSTVTRRQLRLTTHMALKDIATGQVVLDRDLLAVNSFNVLFNQYDTTVSEDDVRQNALDDLARQVEVQLALYFKRGPA